MPKMSKCTKENPTKEERTTQHSRKRKADVAIFLQDPGEHLEMELMEMNKKKQSEEQVDRQFNLWQSDYQFIPRPESASWAPYVIPEPEYASLQFRWSSFSPLPPLSWANPDDVWKNMLHKDAMYVRDKNVFQRHPEMQESMRTVLLDWLMEVSELHKLHRETYYLAQDFLDRFLATQENVMKSKLQLVGVTCLFIAAKMEEIYPPKLHEFSYYADGSCTEDEMLNMELIIMKALNWCLTPITVVSWLNIYLQVAYSKELQHFLLPQYPQKSYLQIMELLDLCTLDVRSLEYSYRVLTAAALYHCTDPEYLQEMTGFQWTDIHSCIDFLLPFALALTDTGRSVKLEYFAGVDIAEMHTIQTYRERADLLENARTIKRMMEEMETKRKMEMQRVAEDHNDRVLTPPLTVKKPLTD
ncbi:G1/S-specific cyclin-E1 [Phyllobates terribilis]|uniref:G1/S-specific cyclin-E1 n=1 Tax=Phyllobates terribilis TaxID=111132 RepID=UPI003CCADA3F